MKFVATKTVEQLDLQALHRVRERLVSQRTGIINQIRAFLLERGVAVRQGQQFFRAELPRILATPPDVLSPRMVRIIEGLASDLRLLDKRIQGLSGEIEELAKRDAGCEQRNTCRVGSSTGLTEHPRCVCYRPDSDQTADIELGRYCAGRAVRFDRLVCASRFRKIGR